MNTRLTSICVALVCSTVYGYIVNAQQSAGYVVSQSVQGLQLEMIDTSGIVIDTILLPDIVLDRSLATDQSWITDFSLIEVSPNKAFIVISTYQPGGQRRLILYDTIENNLNSYVMPESFSNRVPEVSWSPDSKYVLIDGNGPIATFEHSTGNFYILSNQSIFAREWIEVLDSIAFVQGIDCANLCAEGYDLFLRNPQGDTSINLSNTLQNNYGIGNTIPDRYGIPTFTYSSRENRFYFAFRESSPLNPPTITIHSVQSDGTDPQVELDVISAFFDPELGFPPPDPEYVELFVGDSGQIYVFAELDTVINGTSIDRVQAIYAIGENTPPRLVFNQSRSIDSDFIVAYDLSLSTDGSYLAFIGRNSKQATNTMTVIALADGSDVFSDTIMNYHCNLDWISATTLLYGVVSSEAGCQPWRPWNQPVDEMFMLDVTDGASNSIQASSETNIIFAPLPSANDSE